MVLQSSCVQDIKRWPIFFKVATIFVYISASSFKAPLVSMDEGRKQLLKGPNTPPYNHVQAKDKEYRWVIMEGRHDKDDDNINGRSSASNSHEDSTASLGSTSSSDMVDDASSTSISCSSSSHSSVSGPLYELSELMAQLPIK